jgi:uncharacterized protein YdhG (YjbR/CyaY superfamily)
MLKKKSPRVKVKRVNEYLASLPRESRTVLNRLRKTIREVVPQATEVISYQIPTFKHKGMLVAYAAFSHHFSLFPTGSNVVEKFKKELSPFERSRGTIRFTAEKPLPDSLVKKIVKARVAENERRAKEKIAAQAIRSGKGTLEFPGGLAKPAQRALAGAGISKLGQLSKWAEGDIRSLHGIGPNALIVLRKALRKHGLRFAATKV